MLFSSLGQDDATLNATWPLEEGPGRWCRPCLHRLRERPPAMTEARPPRPLGYVKGCDL